MQFWSYLVRNKHIDDPRAFIRPLPHISFVYGEENVNFLKKRYEALSPLPMFESMEYSEDHEVLAEWMPLMMEGRATDERVAASRMDGGTDVNFGELTRKMVGDISNHKSAEVHYRHEVADFRQMENGQWEVKVRNLESDTVEYHTADHIFIGAGGHAIPLLQKTGIPESRQLGGFPISGTFLVCNNPEVVDRHDAKVYGKEPKGTPPMTVPHLDRRYLKDKLIVRSFCGNRTEIPEGRLQHGSFQIAQIG